MAGAARIAQIPLQPAEGVFHKVRRLQPLGACHGGGGGIGGIEQQHQSRRELFSGAALRLPLEGMPLTVGDAQLSVQLPGCFLGGRRPFPWVEAAGWIGCCCGGCFAQRRGRHWTDARAWGHPDAMQQRPRSPYPPIRWLHQLAALMAQVARAERLAGGDDSLQARRLRQRMAVAQRLLDPLPKPLQPIGWAERWLWTGLRWGGPSLLLALWLQR